MKAPLSPWPLRGANPTSFQTGPLLTLLRDRASHSDLQPFVVPQFLRGLVRIDQDETLQEPFLDPERIVEDGVVGRRPGGSYLRCAAGCPG
jgi:hypothetical protein